MSEIVLDHLGLNKSTAAATSLSSNIVEAYLLIEGVTLKHSIADEVIEIDDFYWKFSIWDSSEIRLTYDLIEDFNEKSEFVEASKLYILELLSDNTVHIVVDVCHGLTGMPFATGSCALSSDHALHEMELVCM